ncbi:MAG: DUF4116 domain-containing protein, partial [Candidatus Rhabdochlamydia sp.]
MNPTFSPFSSREYCSQNGNSAPSFHMLEAGIKFIEDILQKKTLCCHDVTHLNKVYQTIEQLKDKRESTSNQNSSTLLLNLTQKVAAIKSSQLSAEEIITAYHLQQLKISPLKEVDTSFRTPMDLTLEKMQEIATHLPFCKSGEQFEKDAQALLGKSYSSEIAAILQTKKDQFCEVQRKERLTSLQQLREQNTLLYPSYLEEILREGFFHLYDHLIAMKALSTKAERSAAIENLSFSSFSKIILEFRKIVFSKVDKIMPQASPNTVFLLGNTGSGKSTTLCYLRGDEMIFQDGAYQSSTDKERLIGNDRETSCTLFPNTTLKDDLVLVDFPGFADTHGEVISLAIELTLRSLTRKYSPKIVLLTPITDTESRFTHIHLLGKRLERVLGTLDNCILGLTKYSKDVDFINIQAIEKGQKEKLSSPSEEEKNLIPQITALEPYAGTIPAIQDQVNTLKKKLSQLQELRLSSSPSTLPDTEEKSKHYANLLQKKEDFKKHSGIKNVISLKDLTDPKQLEAILQTFFLQEKTESTVISNTLDPADERLLETLFTHHLKKVIEEKKNLSTPSLTSISKDISKEIEAFGQRILETSLINTLLEKSHPEIGEFLHLESMDPMVVRQYDKKVITDCINGYIDEVISCLLIAEEIIKELKTKYLHLKSDKAEREWTSLRSYILTLSKGIPPNAHPDKIKEAWESLQKEHLEHLNSSEKEFKLSKEIEIILLIPFGIPYGIFSLFKKLKQREISREFMQDAIEKLYQGIQVAGQSVITLKDIENTVKKKDQLDEIFSSHPLSLSSLSSLRESLQNQITWIEKIYGKKEWNERVNLIIDQLTSDLSSIRPTAPIGETLLYALIAQEVSCQELPPYFNEHTFLAIVYSFLNSPPGCAWMSPTGKYQEILKQLFPDWKSVHYKDLKLSDPSYFFHISSVTDQEYHLLNEQRQKLLELCHKNPISRLMFADAVSRLWKNLPPPVNDSKKPEFFNSIKDDKLKILHAIQKNAWILEYNTEHLRSNKEFILSALRMNGKVLAFAHDSFKNDREIVLTAVQEDGSAFQYASDALKDDQEFILNAVQKNSFTLQYVKEALKNDREFVLAAVQKTGSALVYASEALKNDREIVLAAVKQYGYAFLHASEALKNDREVILTAVQQYSYAFLYAS